MATTVKQLTYTPRYVDEVKPNQIIRDMATFGKLQLEASDPDCEYRVLAALYKDWSLENQLWMDLLYVAYTHIPSAYLVYSYLDSRSDVYGDFSPHGLSGLNDELLTLPTSVERRGLRDLKKMREHLLSLLGKWWRHKSLQDWLTQGFGDDPKKNWLLLQDTLQSVRQNGRWAAYKVSELLYANHKDVFPIEPANMAWEGSSGPRWGMELLFGKARSMGELDRQAHMFQHGMLTLGLKMEVDELETLLCNFHSLYMGRYYVGHDIDLIQHQLRSIATKYEWARGKMEPVWEARLAALPLWTLGEVNGWHGLRPNLNGMYRYSGDFYWWTEEEGR